MLCPKCKNPINSNTTVCEWCGADVPQTQKVERSPLNEKLLELCKQGNILAAVKTYKDQTGASLQASKEYVDKLREESNLLKKQPVLPQKQSASRKDAFLYGCLTAILFMCLLVGILIYFID